MLALVPVTLSAQTPTPQERAAFSSNTSPLLQTLLRTGLNARDPVVWDLARWAYYSNDPARVSFEEINSFIQSHKDWPGQNALRATAEKAMPTNMSPTSAIAWFEDDMPQTAQGMDIYLRALIKTNQSQKAASELTKWWAEASLSAPDQKLFMDTWRRNLSESMNSARLQNLIWRQQYTAGRALAARMGGGYPVLTEARIALKSSGGNVDSLIARVPKNLQNDPGLVYDRVKWRRQKDMTSGAIELLRHQPSRVPALQAEDWWKERHILIRRMLEARNYKQAYALAKDHSQNEGVSFLEAEWMAGWLALRHLNQPQLAQRHFTNMAKEAGTPISVARTWYWAGLAAEKAGDRHTANSFYSKAAAWPEVFYGQTAAHRLGQSIRIPGASNGANTGGRAAFEQRSFVRAIRFLHAIKEDEAAKRFLTHAAANTDNAGELTLLADLAQSLNLPGSMVAVSRKAYTKQIRLPYHYAYPVKKEWMPRNPPIEPALIHAITRQESNFDPYARSSANARGLMQLLPGTGRDQAKKLGVSYNDGKLNDPAFNMLLGSAYLAHQVKRFNAYAPAFAGYNAGPGRIPGWLDEFGDPRTGEVDLVDWIESIPFPETRNYVQRVLEGLVVYRILLGGAAETGPYATHLD